MNRHRNMYATNPSPDAPVALQMRPVSRREIPGERRLSVLHVSKFYPPERGGMESHLQTLCEEIHADVDVSVLVAHVKAATVREEMNGVPVTRLSSLGVMAGASLCPSLPFQLRQAANVDVVHLHVPNPPAVAAYLGSGHKGRLVVTYHSDLVRQKILGKMFEPLQQMLLRRADAIIVASPDYLKSSPSLKPHLDRCHVIPLGIHLRENTITSERREWLRRKYGPRVVLAVGRLVYYKGFEYLIEAMRYVDAHLVLIGGGPLREQLERKIDAYDLRRNVTLLGALSDDELHEHYGAADLFVLPAVSRSEAFGIVQVEAMAAGLPVINTQIDSGVPFVSLHGVTGLTVPPRDPLALALGIQHLLERPEQRTAYGRAARKRALEEFGSSAMGHRVVNLYRSVCGIPAETRTLELAGA